MGNRVVPIALIALLVILHVQLWSGRGSVPTVKVERVKVERTEADYRVSLSTLAP